MCTPESVHTGSLKSPILSANDASSNGFCMVPLEKYPKSPFFLAELQSLCSAANSSNVFLPLTINSRYSEESKLIFQMAVISF